MADRQLTIDLFPNGREPAWRIALYGPVHDVHKAACVLDPRHHIRTACVGWADPSAPRGGFWEVAGRG